MKTIPDNFDSTEMESVSMGYFPMTARWRILFDSREEAEEIMSILDGLRVNKETENAMQ